MDHHDRLIQSFARRECEKISKRVIARLKKMTEGLGSGDDTPLKNIWEEVCVQMQHEYSFFWHVYLVTIEQIIEYEVAKVDPLLKEAIWLQTNEGSDWAFSENNEGKPPVLESDIINYILKDFILAEAADYANKRIIKYLEYYLVY